VNVGVTVGRFEAQNAGWPRRFGFISRTMGIRDRGVLHFRDRLAATGGRPLAREDEMDVGSHLPHDLVGRRAGDGEA
jgi:hypothetical protein